MAEKALVFVERMFLAPQARLLFKLRLALPAAVFVARMLGAPQAPCLSVDLSALLSMVEQN